MLSSIVTSERQHRRSAALSQLDGRRVSESGSRRTRLDSPSQRANVAFMPTKTIAYLRVSTDKQADRGVSLDVQRAKLKAYAELYELDLVDIIVHAGPS